MNFEKRPSGKNDPVAVNDAGKPAGKKPALDLTSGNIVSNLLKLSWPVIVSSSLNMLGPTIDVIWVGKLGSVAVAGVGVAGIARAVTHVLDDGAGHRNEGADRARYRRRGHR